MSQVLAAVTEATARLEDIITVERLRVKVTVPRVVRLSISVAIRLLAGVVVVLGNPGRRTGLNRRRCLGWIAADSLGALLSRVFQLTFLGIDLVSEEKEASRKLPGLAGVPSGEGDA